MIGGDKATLHFVGSNKMLNLPSSLIAEIETKEGKLEHLDILRVWVEKTGLKAKPKSWAFKKKVTNIVPNNEAAETSAENENP